MVELTIEQKAKAYDEALEKARQLCAYPTSKPFISDLQDLFPELKGSTESEDERIRKFLISFVELNSGFNLSQEDAEQILAWLEKQGEHAKFRDSIQVGDKVTRNQDGVLVNLSQLNRVAKKDEKQGDDKVEPKFKVGDIIRQKGTVAEYTINKVTDTTYYTNGWSWGIERCEEDYELVEHNAWSEEDEDIKDSIIHQLKMLRGDRNVTEGNKKEIEWLKSLKDRYAFKPSEEQLNGLKEAIEFLGCTKTRREQLQSLYEQLKKLREE